MVATSTTEQQLPTAADGPSIYDLIWHDLQERRAVGVARYGIALQANNGRDALRDLYEELLDAACYVRQLIEERDTKG